MSPLLRAAIETDTATIEDMLRTESLLALEPDEILELHDKTALLVRVPQGAPALATTSETRLVHAPTGWRIEVATPILDRGGNVAGTLVLARPVTIPPGTSTVGLARKLAPIRVDG
jgi:hypothetical protein